MNYLAHAYCSFKDPPVLVGNMISDFIKGKKQFDYPAEIQRGIRLHRLIDTFTDAHPAVKEAKAVFRPVYRLYAGAFVDVSFDYFIANDPQLFADEKALKAFALFVYDSMDQWRDWIPPATELYFSRMKEQDWLSNYRLRWGIEKSFGGVVYRSAFLNDAAPAMILFEEYLPFLERCYQRFMPELLNMVAGFE